MTQMCKKVTGWVGFDPSKAAPCLVQSVWRARLFRFFESGDGLAGVLHL
jgi:hypothetical protein